MAEGQELPPLTKPTKHPEEVKGYIEKGAPEPIARAMVAKDIRIERLQEEKKDATDNSLTDSLTGLPNKRCLDNIKRRMFEEAVRMNHGLTALFIDGDDFKQINQQYGEPVGDEVIKELAKVMRESLREIDFLARFGGEEFVALLPQSHNLSPEEMQKLCKRLNNAVEQHAFPDGIKQTISIGVASFSQDQFAAGPDELIRKANDAEHQAKNLGKNRFVVWDHTVPTVLRKNGVEIKASSPE